MKTRNIKIEDAVYVERSYALQDALRLSKEAIYQDLENEFNDFEINDFRSIPIKIEEDYIVYKMIPTEYISNVLDPVRIIVN